MWHRLLVTPHTARRFCAAATACTGWASPLLAQQHRHSSSIPDHVKNVLEHAPFAAALIPGGGRGLVAARPIQQGEVLLEEWPFVCVPSIQNRCKVRRLCLVVIQVTSRKIVLSNLAMGTWAKAASDARSAGGAAQHMHTYTRGSGEKDCDTNDRWLISGESHSESSQPHNLSIHLLTV